MVFIVPVAILIASQRATTIQEAKQILHENPIVRKAILNVKNWANWREFRGIGEHAPKHVL